MTIFKRTIARVEITSDKDSTIQKRVELDERFIILRGEVQSMVNQLQ